MLMHKINSIYIYIMRPCTCISLLGRKFNSVWLIDEGTAKLNSASNLSYCHYSLEGGDCYFFFALKE